MSEEQKPVIEKVGKDAVNDFKEQLKGKLTEGGADESAEIPPSKYRHPKENFYFKIAAVTGGVFWALILYITISTPSMIVPLVVLGLMLFVMLRLMKATFFGNALNVNEKQCPEIYAEVQAAAQKLGVKNVPYIFIVNSDGAINAMAIRLVGRGYVLLLGGLVDHYLRDGHEKELQFIITHELAHHAAGHTALWKVLLTGIAAWVPLLGKAYGRACEHTCDRAGALAIGDGAAAENALMSLAHGSEAVKAKLDVEAFLEQERHIPEFFGFLMEINYSHPRLTSRVLDVREFLRG